jgi:hypothetical protein
MFVVQIKEKFGGIRFCMSESDSYIDGVIDLGIYMSFQICEFCGNKAAGLKSINGFYYKTLCLAHYEELVSKAIKW